VGCAVGTTSLILGCILHLLAMFAVQFPCVSAKSKHREGQELKSSSMDVDWSVELGTDDPTLAVPWESEDGTPCYYDLRARPELLLYVDEAVQHRELGEFLTTLNSPASRLQTAKCDVWISRELSEAEGIYGAACKFCSYVDLFFTETGPRVDFPGHEAFAVKLTTLLKRAPEISAAAEFIIRRAHYDGKSGFYFTFELAGYGDDEDDAKKRWTIALNLIANAILQVSVAGQSPQPAS
jgi:hypothetical protein